MNEEQQRLLAIGARWEKIENWYRLCLQEIYPEKRCRGHIRGTKEVIKKFVVPRLSEIKTVLDVGCGCAPAYRFFKALGILWVGVTLGQYDLAYCRRKGLRVFEYDQHFIDLPDECVSLLFCRHIAEHSPMPLFALKEWHRLAQKYLLLVVPRVPYFCRDEQGRHHPNHYSAGLTRDGWLYLAEEAGWELIDEDYIPTQIEERLFFRKAGTNYP